MNVLFLGNSFTFFHDMPGLFAEMSGAGAAMLTRGGAYLRDFLNEADPLCPAAEALLSGRMPETPERILLKRYGAQEGLAWDYVVMQEQSFNAVGNFEDYLQSAAKLCARIREAGAVPVIYATWPYRDDTDKMRSTGISYGEMRRKMRENCMKAAQENGALFADAGEALVAVGDIAYEPDNYHPSKAGSMAAARAIWEAIGKK